MPPGADSLKAKTAMLAILQSIQSAEHAVGNMSVADSVTLSKTEGYMLYDFIKTEVQIKSFTPVLTSMIGPGHASSVSARPLVNT